MPVERVIDERARVRLVVTDSQNRIVGKGGNERLGQTRIAIP
jgi:hypothetical protein